jgi:nucleobase:cation symporter-1, NCS1 family
VASPRSIVREVDGRFEFVKELETSSLYNKDLAPTPIAGRTWSYYEYASIWIGMAVCVPTWMLGASMIAAGFDWVTTMITIALGNIIVLVPMVMNSFPGAKFGIPFAVLLRSSFGVYGTNIPSLLRGGVAAGWFGIQTWIGGAGIDALLTMLVPAWANVPAHTWIAFAAFWAMNMAVCWYAPPGKSMPAVKLMADYAAPVLLLIGVGLLWWAISAAGGLGPILSQPSTASMAMWPAFLTAMVAYWATMALSIADITRFAKSQKVQYWGQILGMPTTMTIYAFFGVAVTSATVVIYGQAIWDPIEVMTRTGSPLFIFVGLVFIILATLTTNVTANIVAPAYAISNLAPSRISWRAGALITGVIGVIMQPWRLLESYGAYVFDWLGSYGGILGPIAGIMIADYWLCRRHKLHLHDLYLAEGRYRYWKGLNPAGVFALAVGIAASFLPLEFIALWRWFVGAFVGLVAYWLAYEFYLVKAFPGETETNGRNPALQN